MFAAQCISPRTDTDQDSEPFPDIQGSIIDENNWIRSFSNETYLWYDEIVDIDPADHEDPLEYFALMKTAALTPSGNPKDRFHFTLSTERWQELSQAGVSAGYGMTLSIISSTPPREAIIAYTEPNSPATAIGADLLRGTSILEVDGIDFVNDNTQIGVNTINAGLFPDSIGEDHQFVVQDLNATEPRTIGMRSALITQDPVPAVEVFDTPDGPVGYILFNDHIATAEQALIDAVNQLNTAIVTDLVLDLRYNGGGFLAIASELAYMIAGPVAMGRTFEQLEFNDKLSQFNRTTLFHDESVGFSTTQGLPLPSLDLSRVFILTSEDTCSASESIMNGLRGIGVEVIQIGTTTCGKPYGFLPEDNCGTTYFTIQFRGANELGFGDYTDGFSPVSTGSVEGTPLPGCRIADDLTHLLGDPEELRFNTALYYRENGECPLPGISSRSLQSLSPDPLTQVHGRVTKSPWLRNRILD